MEGLVEVLEDTSKADDVVEAARVSMGMCTVG